VVYTPLLGLTASAVCMCRSGSIYLWSFLLFFFFQAEDGIRDWSVTGVQTCALPILRLVPAPRASRSGTRRSASPTSPASSSCWRSEERRVGKECRSRGLPYH